MKFIFTMSYSDPVQNISLKFKNLKEECLAKGSQTLASRRLVRPMFLVTSNKETCVNHSYGRTGLQNGYKNGASLRSL